MQIRQISGVRDSLVWTSDTIPYLGNHFHFRSLGSLIGGNTYGFSIEIFTNDTRREDFKSIYFTMNTPPSTPVIGSDRIPVFKNQQITLSITPSRDRQVSASEIIYRIQILEDSLATKILSDTLLSAQSIHNNQITLILSTKLKDNTVYYYRVQAGDGVEFSERSPSQQFYINHTNDPPGPFTLIYPLNGDTLSNCPILTWQVSSDPDAKFGADSVSYIIEFSTDPTFNYYVNRTRLSNQTTSYLPNKLQNHETYYWRVLAIDTKGASQISSQVGCFTLNTGNQVPAIPRILAPLDKQILAPNQYVLWQF
ncbi:MAG: hypothetical protein JXR87_04140, partial [Candidatus Marinimicrobia bacterium]|nr:hypothetical protein [Candidatus Neomarinimicrobiota bacterium]